MFKTLLNNRAQQEPEGTEPQRQAAPDLSSPPVSSSEVPQADLSTTFDAFESRIQLRKSARKVQESEAEQAQKARHALLLNTMMNIRRSLAKLTHIDLGERFALTLDADDWHGWPRLIVRLNDQLQVLNDAPMLQILAHDRLDGANVELAFSRSPRQEKLSLVNQQEAALLPAVLKRCVREYLDAVERVVVEAETAGHSDEAFTPLIASVEENETPTAQPLSGDVFVDEEEMVDQGEELPVLDQLESLPLINSKLTID